MKGKKSKEIKQSKKVKVPKTKKEIKSILKEIFFVNGKFEFKALVQNIAISLGGAIIIGLLTRNGMATYASLKKPSFAPPAIIFPIVWTILYTLMGIAAYRIYMNNKQGKKDNNAYFYYLMQLSINFLWSIVFFNLKLYGVAFIVLIILLTLITITTIKFLKVDKIAAYLMLPYILWVTFAGVLSYYIWMLNEM